MFQQIDEEIGKRLSARRRELGLAIETLAGALGVGVAALAGFEAGSKRLSARVLQACCRELHVPPSFFLAPAQFGVAERDAARDELLDDAHRLHRAFFRIESPDLRKILVDLAVAFSEGGASEAVARQIGDLENRVVSLGGGRLSG
jgi:transcriptional regulator with XRE-family HTH domain